MKFMEYVELLVLVACVQRRRNPVLRHQNPAAHRAMAVSDPSSSLLKDFPPPPTPSPGTLKSVVRRRFDYLGDSGPLPKITKKSGLNKSSKK